MVNPGGPKVFDRPKRTALIKAWLRARSTSSIWLNWLSVDCISNTNAKHVILHISIVRSPVTTYEDSGVFLLLQDPEELRGLSKERDDCFPF